MYSCQLLLISSAPVRSIPFLFFGSHLCVKYSLSISDFFEEISSLSHSIVVLYFFALITEKCFLISPYYSLEFCIQMAYLSFSPLLLSSLLFAAICKVSSDSSFALLHFFFYAMHTTEFKVENCDFCVNIVQKYNFARTKVDNYE